MGDPRRRAAINNREIDAAIAPVEIQHVFTRGHHVFALTLERYALEPGEEISKDLQ